MTLNINNGYTGYNANFRQVDNTALNSPAVSPSPEQKQPSPLVPIGLSAAAGGLSLTGTTLKWGKNKVDASKNLVFRQERFNKYSSLDQVNQRRLSNINDFIASQEAPETLKGFIKPLSNNPTDADLKIYAEQVERLKRVGNFFNDDDEKLAPHVLVERHNQNIIKEAKLKGFTSWQKDPKNLAGLDTFITEDPERLKAHYLSLDDLSYHLTKAKTNLPALEAWAKESAEGVELTNKNLTNAGEFVADLANNSKHWTKGAGIAALVAGGTAGLYYVGSKAFGNKKPSTEASTGQEPTA